MNENNRRGGGVFVTAEPRKDTGMESHQLPSINRDDFKPLGLFFMCHALKRTWKVLDFVHQCSKTYTLLQLRILGRYVRYYRATNTVNQTNVRKTSVKVEDTYLYATIHNVESINQIAYQNSIQKEGAIDYEVYIHSLLIQVRVYPFALFPFLGQF